MIFLFKQIVFFDFHISIFVSFSSHLLASNTSAFMLLSCMKQYCQVIEIIIRIINKLEKNGFSLVFLFFFYS